MVLAVNPTWKKVCIIFEGFLTLPDGKQGYEPVNPLHSWNADTRITNFLLFKLQRHSDHHAFASRRYQILRSFTESPQMPTGYAGMITLALIPPLWFWVMDDRVKKNEEKLANSTERKEWEKNWKAYQ
jgi:alkane 1-monooxygenase